MKWENKKNYTAHLRIDPSDSTKARMIVHLTASCRPSDLHKRLATLEAHLLLDDPKNNYRIIHVDDGDNSTYTDERTVLQGEDRAKINVKIPEMLLRGQNGLDKLFKKHFQDCGVRQYIG